MNSNFSLKSSIALLVLGASLMANPKQPAKSTFAALVTYQSAISASAIWAIASTIS
jgi:hypothetical protein